MVKRGDLKLPLFTVSPKTYFVGKDAISAARIADEVAAGRRHTIFYSAPMPELYQISRSVSNVLVTAQHADLVGDGKGMGLAPWNHLKALGSRPFSSITPLVRSAWVGLQTQLITLANLRC